ALGRIVVGRTAKREPVTAADLGAAGAMTALLRDALMPNLAQTAEGTPAIVHGGPFANIAHGCSSVLGTRLAQSHADVVVTEAGFGFDLGGEKFLDIKCRSAGLEPALVVLVATCRALEAHGGAEDLEAPNLPALEAGLANLDHHLDAVAAYGLKPVVAVNVFPHDTEEELQRLLDHCAARGVPAAPCRGFAEGGEGALEIADVVRDALAEAEPKAPAYAYAMDASYAEKIDALAKRVYGADGVDLAPVAKRTLARLEKEGLRLPVCVAKTPLSISDDAKKIGRPRGFRMTVREARLSAGAGFVVLLLGDVMTMPGLPREPSARHVRVEGGRIRGLMQGDG
ncbi:MAG TPA: formate--tetrahydrofolate ligase, partial [Polyangiaceae bacterium LLY-WYZ-15_(1-7)]|nr:formate--tetrahydrofolate ligase [Polyangiaceae bacterium LLY-WYZ-15_(1-7)]